ncbi:MAG: hypothetical protein KY476_16825 [Planctomycetes bacterium]|nr:hypothetical protein [Planctomycetota bacterium]
MAKPKSKSSPSGFGAIEQPEAPGGSAAEASTQLQQPTAPEEQGAAFGIDHAAETFGVDREYLEAQRSLEEKLQFDEVTRDPAAFSVDGSGYGLDNILGTGIGIREREGHLTGEIVLKVFVRKKVREPAQIADGRIEPEHDGVPTDVEEMVEGSAYDRRERPAPCGASVAHATGRIGTIGSLGIRDNKCVLLSNNHVLAKENRARRGDAIVQPGGGVMPRDWIGYLEDFVPLQIGGFNTVDCAIGWVPTDGGYVTPSHRYFTIDPAPTSPRLYMTVKKEGRTTGSTLGMIADVNVKVRDIAYLSGKLHFQNVVIVKSSSSSRPYFGQPGDSGSLIVEAATNRPVALLFGGGGLETFGNPIVDVMRALRIERFLSQF